MSQFLTPTFFCILLCSSSSVAQSQPLQLLAWPTVNAARTDVALGTNGKIAFVKYSANASNIFVMNADGTDQSNVTYGSSPAWSPNGSQIAFAICPPCDIFLMNANGSGMTSVANNAAPGGHVAWSPDGSRILYSRLIDASDPHSLINLYLVNSAGGTPSQLTNGAYRDVAPVWSPDGSLIAFDSDRNQPSCATGTLCTEI